MSHSFPIRSFRPNGQSPNPWRLRVFQAVIILSFGFLVFRLYQVQFVEGSTYVQQANDNRLDQVSIPAPRGIITDRYGVPLAVNVASANVTVTPALLPDNEDDTTAVLQRLAGLINIPLSGPVTINDKGLPQKSLSTLVNEEKGIAPYRPIVVATDIDQEIARTIIGEKSTLPGVDVEWVSVRDYPTGALTSQIIGYMGPIPDRLADQYTARGYVLDRDRIGYDGIEFTEDDILSGQPGVQTVVRDVAGQIVQNIGDPRPPVPGHNIQLTIDVQLQQLVQKALTDEITFLNSYYGKTVTEQGVVIVSNPKTGEILSMVSWPTYDNERFARNIDYPYYEKVSQDPLHPLFNQAVGSLYPPGSIFKTLTLTAALEEGVITPDKLIFDPGHITLVNRYYANDPGKAQTFVCWIERTTHKGHGYVDARHAIAWSCDVYFYKVGGGFGDEVPGLGLDITRLGDWMKIFGLGHGVGVELPGDQNIQNVQIIPTPDWKRRTWGENWSTGDTYNSAFGQGYVLVTPIQMLNVINSVIDDGYVARLTLVHQLTDAEGHVTQPFAPDIHDMRTALQAYWPNGENHNGAAYPGTLSQSMQVVRDGMRMAVTDPQGTAVGVALPYVDVAGKTGTAEYCDDNAAKLNLCQPGNWPAHAWFMAYAPWEDPEISVIAFVYNGSEGALVALPVVRQVMADYYQLKAKRAAEQQANEERGITPTAGPPSFSITELPFVPIVPPGVGTPHPGD